MNFYKVKIESISSKLKREYKAYDTERYYKNEEGQDCFDVYIIKYIKEDIVKAFNEAAIYKSLENSEIHKILEIKKIKEESNIFDSLEKVEPNYIRTVENGKIISEEIIGEEQRIVQRTFDGGYDCDIDH